MKKRIIEKTQRYGLAGLGFVLRLLVRLFYGKNSWKEFGSTSTIRWHVHSYLYYFSPAKIDGIDTALKANLLPSEAVDKLAREVGIPEKTIKESI